MKLRAWLFSLSGLVWVVTLLATSVPAWRVTLIARSGQPAAHWRQGAWMIEHHALPADGPLTHTATSAPRLDPTWLSDLVLAFAGHGFGWNGLIMLAAAIFATILWRLYRLLIDEGADALLAMVLTGLGAVALAGRLETTPALATQLLTVLFVAKLRAFEQDRLSSGRLFLWLIPLTALWANLDTGFVVGLALVAMMFLGQWRARRKAVPLAVIGVGALAASLANPATWRLHARLLTFTTDPLWGRYATEWGSPNFHLSSTRGLLLLLALLTLLLTVARPRLRASEVWWLAVWGWLALRAERWVPTLTMVALPILAAHWSVWFRRRRDEEGRTAWHATAAWLRELQTTGRTVMVMAAMILIAVWAWNRSGHPVTVLPADRWPLAAARFVEQHPEQIQGRLFHDAAWGGYLIWRLPAQPVFLDQRAYRYEDDVVRDFAAIDRVTPNWQDVANRRQIGWTLLPVAHGLNTLLGLAPGWNEIYRDEVAVIFGRSVSTD